MGQYSALAGTCADIEMRSLVQARDDVSRAVCILWVYTKKRQKNIRTKEFIEYSNVCSSGLDEHLFIQCYAPMVLCLRLIFEG